MAKGQPTVPVTPAKSGGARNESSSPAPRFAAATELSVSIDDEADIGPDAHDYEDYEDKTPAPEPGPATPETATLSSGDQVPFEEPPDELDDVAGPEPACDDHDDGTQGSKPSVASAKHSALLKAPRPPINGNLPAAKRVFDRVQALIQNDEWMQLFKPIPRRKSDWPALAQELQYPVNSVSTSQVVEDSKKLRKAFGAVGINAGKQPVSRTIVQDEDPSTIPLPPTPKRLVRTPPTKRGAERGAFGTTEASPYFQDSHMVTPRSESRMQRVYVRNEGSFGRRGGARAPKGGAGRRQVDSDGSSSDDDILVRTFDEEDPQVELMRQTNKLAALNTTNHDTEDRNGIAPTVGSDHAVLRLSQQERELYAVAQWSPGRAIQWFRQLSKKTKRKWKLLSDAFIRYYCSQLTQTALSCYYSAKRERNEHLCDYINRLNGYARTACLHFEKSGRDAKEHVQHFMATCDDDKLAERLYHARVTDIHELEEIIEDVLKGKERTAKRDSEYRYSKRRDARRDDAYARNNRRDDRRRDDSRNKPSMTLIEATVDDLLAELVGREATQGGTEYSNEDPNAYDDVQDEYNDFQPDNTDVDFSLDKMTDTSPRLTKMSAVQLLKAPTHVQTTVNRAETRLIARMASIKIAEDQRGRRDFNRDNRDAHNLTKFVRTKGTKEELPPELKAVVQERH
ncbi:hypothetical protein PInf_005475 [Phytophthora infestans]|nr:hypothetical protein PInf_005475 [Phytophthora infestans]